MSFLRSTALRASSLARAARPVPCLRTAELQPWQRATQRRSYASGHGAHGQAQSSEVPWMAAGVAMTAGGLFFVMNQDLGHGPGHDEDHHAEAHETHGKNEGQDEPDADEDKTGDGAVKSADSADDAKDVAKDTATPKPRDGKANKHEDGDADKSDKADPRGKSKSSNETSGKQEGLSNADTHHSTNVSESEDKSKKGEGVAETAKVKGPVSPDRPSAENKEERGKAQSDKN